MIGRKWPILLSLVALLFGVAFYMDFRILAEPQKGIAMSYFYPEDLPKVNAEWWHIFGPCQSNYPAGCVPMSWGGNNVPGLDPNYDGYLLFLNEPDRPDQSNKTPAEGIALYKQRKAQYPNAKFVVGNTFYPQWLFDFKALCKADTACEMPTIWGLHAYMGNAEYLPKMFAYLDDAHSRLGGEFWITEFASVFGDMFVDDALVNYFQSHDWIKRWAYWTNRYQGNEAWYPPGWNTNLFDWATGEPTKIGNWYIHGLHKTFISIVIKG
jgi:hypothetical protein